MFLVICVAVHVYGLASPISDESVSSHIVHSISYLLCLWAVLHPSWRYALFCYIPGMLYPVAYHALCAYRTFAEHGEANFICLLVVFLLPVGAWWLSRVDNRPT